ncbi:MULTISPECIES: hypothetical protein [unclassified Chryseobacterium]|jgi:translation elongation factor EF-Tu-like GTPase|uniref:hypothetical protein n=1 Tax=unclassified Chryseobacterium TaxID=2593645 RepID=UPI001C5AD29A|nr:MULTISPECIES: hypothetical protein [unclassified Chryseobacterium]MBW3521218.1 hypothetical protein [Chryseobacterium sp. NKUCC03_KSP]MCD0456838.1 hypothetical protein [Chryseobacterium sp. LC2016-27]
MKKPSHFKALINYYTTEKGGLVTPISTGSRASFQFPFELRTYIGIHMIKEEELIFAGDSVTLDITLVNAESFLEKLYKGMDFEISDHSGIIGSGVITEVY